MAAGRQRLRLNGGPIAVLTRVPGLALLSLFAVLFALFSLFTRRFFSAANIEDILAGYSFMAILTIGQAFPIIARGIDLSVGSNVALGAMILFDLNMIFGRRVTWRFPSPSRPALLPER